MRTRITLLALLLPVALLFGQDTKQEEPLTFSSLDGVLRLQGTITPAWAVAASSGKTSGSISGGRTNIYLHGTSEYYLSERISLRGDLFYFVNKNKVAGGMIHNHSFEVGTGFHLLKGSMIDPFIGAGAGMNLAQINPIDIVKAPSTVWLNYAVPAHVDPIWGPRVGINFYGQRVFHFFIEAHYFMGTYRPDIGPALSLNELRVSAGLGWNFVFLKKEATVRPTI